MLSLNSVEFALSQFKTFLQNSIIAICNPKQIPRYGVDEVRAYSAANIFPSIPLSPNPPGTKIPSAFFNLSQESA